MIEIYAADYAALNSIPAPCEVIPMELGYQGEDGTRCVVFDLSSFISEVGEGTAAVVVQRYGETIPYLATDIETINETLVWTLTDVDTSIAGYGYAQLRYTVADGNVRTAVYKTVVYESLGAAGPTPNPMQDLIDEVQAFAEASEAAATAATTAASSAGDSATAASASALSAAGSAQTAQAAATTLAITESVSGTIATFTDGANGLPVVDLTAQINPVQTGSSDPSPTNIRPISGWAGVTVTRTGAEGADSQTYSVDWTDEAGTVYGGSIDLTTGLLTVDNVAVDMATLTWDTTSWGAYRTSSLTSVIDKIAAGEPFNGLCEAYSNATYQDVRDGLTNAVAAEVNGRLYVRSDGTPTGLMVYPLATPQTYQLDPVEVRTLLGVNNISADTGDVALTYRADTKLYIDKVLAGAQATEG